MNAIPISPVVVERLGWMLVHSLWQFAAIALVGFLLDLLITRRSSGIRYVTLLSSCFRSTCSITTAS